MVDGIVVAIQGVHGLQLFKGHAAFSAITLFSGFGSLELGAGGLLKKKSRVLAFHQLLDFIIKALDGSILRQFSLADKVSQQCLDSGVVLGLCAGQGQFNRIADFQILQFSGVIIVLLLIIGLKLGDLILKGLGVTRSLLQRFKLGVTLFDGVLGGGQFGVTSLNRALVTKEPFKPSITFVACSSVRPHSNSFSLVIVVTSKILFYRGLGTTIFPVLFTAHHRETAKMV